MVEMTKGIGLTLVSLPATAHAVGSEQLKIFGELCRGDVMTHTDGLLPRLIGIHFVDFLLNAFMRVRVVVVDEYIYIFILLCAGGCVRWCAKRCFFMRSVDVRNSA